MKVDFEQTMAGWANATPSVSGLVLIGSRGHSNASEIETPDEHSDWDFEIITSNPSMFANRDWTKELLGLELRAYAVRSAEIGQVPKVNAVFAGAEMDMVVIHTRTARLMKIAVALGLHKREGKIRNRIKSLVEVIRPGWRFLKGAELWDKGFRRIVAEVDDPRLGDSEAAALAERFVCDYVWCERKIIRGELRAVQRVLYRELAEVNLQLLHELKRRRGELTFTKARRIESVGSPDEISSVTLAPSLDRASLRDALERSAMTCRKLMAALDGGSWRWPLLLDSKLKSASGADTS